MKSQKELLKELQELAKSKLESNERFHDYGHAISVYKNAEKIIKLEKAENKVNVLAVLSAALFHDISNAEKYDSLESAKLIPELLGNVKDFPKDLIKEVQRLIICVESGMLNENNLDEIIVYEADGLEALSKLSICRAFMMYGDRRSEVKDAIESFIKYLAKKEKDFSQTWHTKTAQKIAKKQMPFIKKFLDDCLKVYKD